MNRFSILLEPIKEQTKVTKCGTVIVRIQLLHNSFKETYALQLRDEILMLNHDVAVFLAHHLDENSAQCLRPDLERLRHAFAVLCSFRISSLLNCLQMVLMLDFRVEAMKY